mmetsp:Transcript_17508/g.37872  ORF Transcript_17508/g.37872 Transcript_17508/m.37872 type:complete len:515 (+) Transcript_17508:20-1564(+)
MSPPRPLLTLLLVAATVSYFSIHKIHQLLGDNVTVTQYIVGGGDGPVLSQSINRSHHGALNSSTKEDDIIARKGGRLPSSDLDNNVTVEVPAVTIGREMTDDAKNASSINHNGHHHHLVLAESAVDDVDSAQIIEIESRATDLKNISTKHDNATVPNTNMTIDTGKSATDNISIKQNNHTTHSHHHCQTLWFAGFYDGGVHVNEYARFYSAALLSAKESAPGLFQPILLVGHLEEDRDSIPPEVQRVKDQFYQWVQDQGGTVIHRDRLSFQEVINQYYSDHAPSHRQGPFFRLDIPNIVMEHKLLEREGVCQHDDIVLYTDCDVLFMNVTASSLAEAKGLVSSNDTNYDIVAYGPQQQKQNVAWNTGVMFLSVSKFGSKVQNILRFGLGRAFKFISFDQGLMNAYFNQKWYQRAILPLEWNYKAYWGQPSTSNPKSTPARIVHFHGPKPYGKTLDCLASMNPFSSICLGNTLHTSLIDTGFQADGGLFANQTLERFYQYVNSCDWEQVNAGRAM